MIRRYVGLGATCGARPGDVCWRVLCNSAVSRRADGRRMLGESREKPRGVLFKGAIWRLGGVAPAPPLGSWGPGVGAAGRPFGASGTDYSIEDRSPGLLRGDCPQGRWVGSCRRAVAQGGEGLAMGVAPAPPSSWGIGV